MMTEAEIRSLYLEAGKMVVTKKPSKIVTVLGSCVSVTLHHHVSGLSAICHALYSECPENGKETEYFMSDEALKFVDCSIERMLRPFIMEGINPEEIEIKLFGGSEILNTNITKNSVLAVGKKNVETALRVLEKNHLKIKARDTGGKAGRKLIFDTETGDVFVRKIK